MAMQLNTAKNAGTTGFIGSPVLEALLVSCLDAVVTFAGALEGAVVVTFAGALEGAVLGAMLGAVIGA